MRNITSKFLIAAACSGALTAFAADPSTANAVQGSSVVTDCNTLKGDAKKECVKVAVQMDQSASGAAQPAPRPPAPSDTKPVKKPDPTTNIGDVHSSPIMTTPDEKIAAEAARKGQDPTKALEKKHEKDQKEAARATSGGQTSPATTQ